MKKSTKKLLLKDLEEQKNNKNPTLFETWIYSWSEAALEGRMPHLIKFLDKFPIKGVKVFK